MYVIKNALKSIARSKMRNFLIFILVLAISITSCIALSIKHSAEVAKATTKENLTVNAQIVLDRQKIMESSGQDRSAIRELMNKSLSLDELKKLSTSETVKDFYYYSSIGLSATTGVEPISTQASSSSSNSNNKGQEGPGGKDFGGNVNRGDFTLTGYSSHEGMTSFINGTSKITSGAMFDESDDSLKVIISQELATLNNLKVGDAITLANPNHSTETYKLTISGIYTSDSTSSAMDFGNASNVSNQIYLSYNSLNKIVQNSTQNAVSVTTNNQTSTSALVARLNANFEFSDVSSYEKFKTDAVSLGLDTNTYTITSSDVENYTQSLVPLENLSKYAMVFLFVVFIIGGLILVVFNLFSIRERKYEIGVLAAIGMKKVKVAMQFITETFVVTLMAIIIGTGIGAASSVPVANKMLESQVQAVQTTAQTQMNNFGGNFQGKQHVASGNMSQNGGPAGIPGGAMGQNHMPGGQGMQSKAVNYIKSITASTDIIVLLEIIGIGILLAIIASSVGIISILRYEPLKILSSRS